MLLREQLHVQVNVPHAPIELEGDRDIERHAMTIELIGMSDSASSEGLVGLAQSRCLFEAIAGFCFEGFGRAGYEGAGYPSLVANTTPLLSLICLAAQDFGGFGNLLVFESHCCEAYLSSAAGIGEVGICR